MTVPSSSLRLLRLPAPRLLRPSTSTPCRASVPSIRSYHSKNTLRLSSLRIGAARSLTSTAPIAQTSTSTSTFTSPSTTRTFSSASGKSPADEIVDELQELYENAKDEFEIATDSTDSGTIYAPSDRESARDALNQLLIVFELYTQDHSPTQTAVREQVRAESENEAEGRKEGEEEEGQIIETNFDPSAVEPGVREEVKRRVAQRVRELRNAVELLEERALTE